MKRRFIVLIDASTKEQDAAFLNFLKSSKGFGYWHWLESSWLLTSSSDVRCEEIRDKIVEIYPNINNMVLEFRDDGTDTWGGFGPKSEKSDMFKWMRDGWKQI
jgi:hypothetical protein